MKKFLLLILFFTCLATTGQAQDYPHFRVRETAMSIFCYPKKDNFKKDNLYYFDFWFQDANHIRPLKKMLQELLEKEVYQKHPIEGDPSMGRISILYSGKGKAIKMEFYILKEYKHLFPDQVLWKIHQKIKRMKLKLPPIVGNTYKRPVRGDMPWIKNEKGNWVIAYVGEKVKHPEFFYVNCDINREVDFGIEHRFKDYDKKKKNKANKKKNIPNQQGITDLKLQK